jgi:hypothetical protein
MKHHCCATAVSLHKKDHTKQQFMALDACITTKHSVSQNSQGLTCP